MPPDVLRCSSWGKTDWMRDFKVYPGPRFRVWRYGALVTVYESINFDGFINSLKDIVHDEQEAEIKGQFFTPGFLRCTGSIAVFIDFNGQNIVSVIEWFRRKFSIPNYDIPPVIARRY